MSDCKYCDLRFKDKKLPHRFDCPGIEIEQLVDALEQVQAQIDALQQKVHLCAGYDNLEKELAQDKAVIVGKMSRIKQLEATLPTTNRRIEWKFLGA